MAQTASLPQLGQAATRVSWTFWAYVNGYMPMTIIDPTTNQVIPVVKRALDAGLDGPTSNAPPVASFTSACTALSCTFDGTSSTDADGSITGYAWTFGDGATSTASAPTHAYATAGAYSVTLTVTDNLGATAGKTSVVTVTQAPLYASDTFSRVVANGWGVANQGGAWTPVGTAARFAVNGGVGAITMPTPGSGPSIFLNGVSSTNIGCASDGDDGPHADRAVACTWRSSLVAPSESVTTARRSASALRDRSAFRSARVAANGAETAVTNEATVAGLTYAAQTSLRIRVQAVGTNPTVLRAKVWAASGAEPPSWGTTGADSTAAFQVPGGVGMMSYLSGSATNAPVVARFDDLTGGSRGLAIRGARRTSVAEVRELQRDPEVVVLHRLDRRLQVVALLAAHAELVALHLVLHALEPEALEVLADLACLVAR